MNEIWKTIRKYPLFQVSNMGRVRRKAGLHKSSHLLKVTPHGRVTFCYNNLQATSLVYPLVLQAFAPKHAYARVVHKNGDVTDNRLSNLKPVSGHHSTHHTLVFYPVTYYSHGNASVSVYDGEHKSTVGLFSFLQWLKNTRPQSVYEKQMNVLLKTLSLSVNDEVYRIKPQGKLHHTVYSAFFTPTKSIKHKVRLTRGTQVLDFSSFSLAALWVAFNYHYSRGSAKEVLLYNEKRGQSLVGYHIHLMPIKK